MFPVQWSIRRVWRYQRGNQNQYIEEEQTTKWPKEKVQKDKQRSTKHTYKTKDRVTRTPLKTGGKLRCSGRVGSFCSTSDTRRVNLVTNPVISHARGTILEENPMTFSKISGNYVAQSLILCLVDDCLSFRLYFCWPLHCLSFRLYFCWPLYCLVFPSLFLLAIVLSVFPSLFLLAIVLSVFLQFTTYDYPFWYLKNSFAIR